MLARISLEPNAMKLIKTTLELMAEVVGYENVWRVDYFQSVMTLMVSFVDPFPTFLQTYLHTEMHPEPAGHVGVTAAPPEDSQTLDGSVESSNRGIFRHDSVRPQRRARHIHERAD